MPLPEVISKVWGYPEFLPLQEQAMETVLGKRDSLIVLPTGGGKSLCYQAPALLMEGCAIVVSPLISLMKDQVDALRSVGASAAYLNSSLNVQERRTTEETLRRGELKFLYIAPERLAQEDFLKLLARTHVSFFVVDEAHCISHWGHDFRPEYRELRLIHQRFPSIAIHAFTATATPEVRADIVKELALLNPEILVGNFDRPNLIYRALPRQGAIEQIAHVISRHPNESGIVYAIRRADVESFCAALQARGIKALPYHAGLSQEERKRNQDQFSKEAIDVMVATVAFGMGINRSNLRYVIHAGLPKSIEHYQQETGRAGRDGLGAECFLFHSASDFMTWKFIMDQEGSSNFTTNLQKLSQMAAFAQGGFCRHRALVNYFGQKYHGPEKCQACDFCLGEIQIMSNSTQIAKTILTCANELSGNFGGGYIADLLRSAANDKIQNYGHDRLASYGQLSEHSGRAIRIWIGQLLTQGLLEKSNDLYPTVKITPAGIELINGKRETALSTITELKREKKSKSKTAQAFGEGDKELFETLRLLRRQIADEIGMPAYIVFGDKTLGEIARLKPQTENDLQEVWGVGEKKCQSFGKRFLECIETFSRKKL